MKKVLLSVVSTTLLFTALHADTTSCDAVQTVNTSINDLSKAVADQQALVSKLSDDIGIMADRIGVMADRIVVTEKLLSDTLIVLTGNTNLGNSSNSTNGVVLTKPLDGTHLSSTDAPIIELSTSSNKYLLYASTEPTFDDGKTISLYIESNTGLDTSWKQVLSFAGSNKTIYIAVKSIDANNKISSLSNGVKLILP
ncbi:hypothetical protein MNB_SM-6-376 [hydrothermal vent metagenome]|uniref:Uncharacterized protein n=1 Tax=hydrothermal vent metagenome TaxID=652676 RepID=A0A1W1CDC1_9ZZZZ